MRQRRTRVEQSGYVEGPKDGSYFLRYWTEPDAEGKRTRKSVQIGTKGQFRTKEAAMLSVEAALLRRRINAGVHGKTVDQVMAIFEQNIPGRVNSQATVKGALYYIRQRWGEEPIAELADRTHSKRIELWLNQLHSRGTKNRPGKPLARTTKNCVKIQMGRLFNLAMGLGYIPSAINPMKFVRLEEGDEPVERQTLSFDQWSSFISDQKLPELVRVMGHIAGLTGLRISEILGLRESDFDLDEMVLKVSRRVMCRDIGKPKSKKSAEPIPLPEELYHVISGWLKSPRRFPTPERWLFASPLTGRPYYGSEMRRSYLIPWGEKNGIVKFGWHTFRHSFKKMLESSGVVPRVMQRLMRHSSLSMTFKYGSSTEFEELKAGQQKMVDARNAPGVVAQKRRWA